MAGIYIHIPFCKQACSYCDFYFITREDIQQKFIDRLCDEIDFYGERDFFREPVRTIYIGGGTPSRLSTGSMGQIFQHLHKSFTIHAEEITMEMNPDDVSTVYLSDMKSLGINRASMGIQTFHPERLRFMNRAHTRNDAINALEALHEAGFTSFSADLIYGNPGQNLTDLEEDIDLLLRFKPPHISAYALTIEPRTRLGKQAEAGKLKPADDGLVADHIDLLTRRLYEADIMRYEISNFARHGFEAVHNTNYWFHKNYLGLGPSAHSFKRTGREAERWKVISDLKSYLTESFSGLHVDRETLSPDMLAEERIMLGLRTRWGIRVMELQTNYGYEFSPGQIDWLDAKQTEGYLVLEDDNIVLSSKGMKIADYLIVEFLSRH